MILTQRNGWTLKKFNDGISDCFVAEGPNDIQVSGFTKDFVIACVQNRFGVDLSEDTNADSNND